MSKIIDGYNGTDFYWHHEYRHYLRECSVVARRKVRKAFIRAGLPLDGEGPAHWAIVLIFCANDPTILRKYY